MLLFDVLFGVVFPFLCLLMDPVVFGTGSSATGSVLADWRVFAYAAIGVGMLGLIAWLFLGARVEWVAGLVGVAFVCGGSLALLVGLFLGFPAFLATFFGAILSFRSNGLGEWLVVVGVLAVTPLGTAFTYMRNGAYALDCHTWRRGKWGKSWAIASSILGLSFAFGAPYALQVVTTEYVEERVFLILTQPDRSEAAVTELQYAIWCTPMCYRTILWEYRDNTDEARRRYLSNVYTELVHRDITEVLDEVAD